MCWLLIKKRAGTFLWQAYFSTYFSIYFLLSFVLNQIKIDRVNHLKGEVLMFIAMNRFKIKQGCEQDFIEIWQGRDSYLTAVPGFKSFHLLRGESQDNYTLFSSHATWESRSAFQDWTKSEAFRKAHANAGARRDIYLGPPKLECFDVVL